MEHCVECILGMFGATALSVLFPVGMFAVLALSLARADERRRQSLADDLRNDAMLDDTLLPSTLETARLEVRRHVALSRGAAKRVVGDSNEAPSTSFRRASRCLLLKARHQSVAAESCSSPPHPPLPRPRRGTTAPASCVRRDTPFWGRASTISLFFDALKMPFFQMMWKMTVFQNTIGREPAAQAPRGGRARTRRVRARAATVGPPRCVRTARSRPSAPVPRRRLVVPRRGGRGRRAPPSSLASDVSSRSSLMLSSSSSHSTSLDVVTTEPPKALLLCVLLRVVLRRIRKDRAIPRHHHWNATTVTAHARDPPEADEAPPHPHPHPGRGGG